VSAGTLERPRAASAPRPPGSAGPPPTALRPVDWFTVIYLGAVLVPLFVLGPPGSRTFLLAAAHVAGMAAVVLARRLGLARHPVGEFLLNIYPLPLFALLYTEVGTLDRLLHPGVFHDAAIQRIEEAVFGGEPAQTLYRHGSFPLGEYLHLGYFSYYLLAPVLVFTLYFTRPRVQLERTLATISLSFYISFLVFIAWPVAGPYHAFTPPPVGEMGWFLPHVARWVVNRGSSIGAAFPSSHVAVSVAIWLMALRYYRPLGVAYLFLVPALAMGAIYGGFHYATDVSAGAILGILVGTAGHALVVRVSRAG